MTTTWNLPITTLSASSLATFSRCAEQWRRRYLLGQKDPPSGTAVLGNAVHGAAEANYSQKVLTGTDLSVTDVDEAYGHTFEKEIDRAGGPREIDWTMKFGREKYTLSPGKAKDRGRPLAHAYHDTVAPQIQPVAAEEWFRMSLPGVPAPVVGKIDLITERAKVDLKFGSTAKKKPDNAWRTQAMIYMLVDNTDNLAGIGDRGFQWHTGSWGSAKFGPKLWTPEQEPELSMTRNAQNLVIAASFVRSMVEGIVSFYDKLGADQPWPGTGMTHSWACDYCGYRPTCEWWIGAPLDQSTLL